MKIVRIANILNQIVLWIVGITHTIVGGLVDHNGIPISSYQGSIPDNNTLIPLIGWINFAAMIIIVFATVKNKPKLIGIIQIVSVVISAVFLFAINLDVSLLDSILNGDVILTLVMLGLVLCIFLAMFNLSSRGQAKSSN
jgi:hypothetical protein